MISSYSVLNKALFFSDDENPFQCCLDDPLELLSSGKAAWLRDLRVVPGVSERDPFPMVDNEEAMR